MVFTYHQIIESRRTDDDAPSRATSTWEIYEDIWAGAGAIGALYEHVLEFVSWSVGAEILVRGVKKSAHPIEQIPWTIDDLEVSDALALDYSSIIANVFDPGEHLRIGEAPKILQHFIRQALSVPQEDCWVRFHGFYDWVSVEDESLAAQIISFRVSGDARLRVAVERRLNSLLNEYINANPGLSIREQWPEILISVVRARR